MGGQASEHIRQPFSDTKHHAQLTAEGHLVDDESGDGQQHGGPVVAVTGPETGVNNAPDVPLAQHLGSVEGVGKAVRQDAL